ncbi:MAG: hypothetical protein K0S47_407 [Herbinix sp.]|jgi:maltose O-acetyltransferase|nr:hypothetical protein [Herbinix sp.]
MRKIKSKIMSILRTYLHIVIYFICYGDLPTSYYIKRGMKVGKNFHRQTATKFDPAHCFLIEIGDNVTIANHVQILAHDQALRNHLGVGKLGKVVIGNNVFIGAKTIILPNVVIGDNVIIGAGSVVTKDIPENTVAVGIPAKVVSSMDCYLEGCKKELITHKMFGRTYSNAATLSQHKKEILKEACKKDYVYVELDPVIEYNPVGKKRWEE